MNRTKRDILQLLRLHKRISRAQISQELRLTRTAINSTVESMLKAGLLETVGTSVAVSRGRPSEIFQLAGKRLNCLGIAVHAYSIDIVVLNWFHEILASRQIENLFSSQSTAPHLPAKQALSAVMAVIKKSGVRSIQCGAIAYSANAYDKTGSCVIAVNDFASVEQANDFHRRLKAKVAAPIWLERDVNASIQGERAMSRGPSQPSNLLYINDRLGFSMVLDGQPWLGPTAAPRWLGHIQVAPANMSGEGWGPASLGMTSKFGIADRMAGYQYETRAPLDPRVAQQEYQRIFDLYHQKDPVIVAEVQRSFHYLAQEIRNMAAAFSFDEVILDGWSPEILADGIAIIQKRINELSNPPEGWLRTVVRAAKLDEVQQAVGAAVSSIDHLLVMHGAHVPAAGARGKKARPTEPAQS